MAFKRLIQHLRLSLRFGFCLGCVMSLAGAASAQVLPTQAGNFAVEADSQTWRFFANDTSSLEQRIVWRVLSAAGAQVITSIPLAYQEGWQSQELIDAYTLKPDGRRLQIQQDAIQKQSGMMGGSTGQTWPEYRVWQLKFPDVQVGDRVVLHYRQTQLKPFLPGWHGNQWYANHNFTTEKLTIEVQAPKGMPLAVESDGVQSSDSEDAGLQIRRFTTRVEAKAYDTDAYNASTTVARVLVSTIASHEQLADRFAQAMQAKVVQSTALQDIAQRQTQGLTEPADKARALYDWVRKNIRYNAVFIGAGGWVAHDIDHILDKRYGDCKDHVLLLVSLLKAVGIDAVPALINTGQDYALNKVVTVFNHVITYLPTLNVYLDATGTDIPFGELPNLDRGKPVVLARAQGSTLAQTPALTAQGNRVESRGEFTIRANGTLEGTLRITASGRAAILLQDKLGKIPPGMGSEAVRSLLEQARFTGTGVLRYPPLDRDRAQQTLEVDISISNYLSSPEAGSVSANPVIPSFPIYVMGNTGNFVADQRRFAMPCLPVSVREDFKVTYDPKFSIDRIPKAVTLQEQDVRFAASYGFENHVLQGTREYENTNPSMLCDPSAYEKRKVVMRSINRHLRQQLLYQQ